MTCEEIKTFSAPAIASCLDIYNRRRRGEPPYDRERYTSPFTPYELGAIIDRAVELLKGANK